MDPQQELYTAILLRLKELYGNDVYDGFLPPANTPYPFVYLGDFRQNDKETKGAILGTVYPTIHIWHNNPHQRGTVSAMMLNIKTKLRRIEKTANFSWTIKNVEQRILPDNTTKTPLLHGVLELEFMFS